MPKDKQQSLMYVFWELTVGLVLAIVFVAMAPEVQRYL